MGDFFVGVSFQEAFDAYWSFLETLSPRTRSFVLDWLISPFALSEELDVLPSADREAILAELRVKAPHVLEGREEEG